MAAERLGWPLALLLLLASPPGLGLEANLTLEAEAWLFPEDAMAGEQSRYAFSGAVRPEFVQRWNRGDDLLVFEGFYRGDSADAQRTHGDIRELYWHHLGPDWDLRVGIDQVFWGVTEFYNPADIINQLDLVESPEQDDRLGQPMIRWTQFTDWGNLDFFILPYFRERTFPGPGGRLRSFPPVSNGRSEFESGAEQHRIDGAIRYTVSFWQTDWSLSHFSGTSREPLLLPRQVDGEFRLIPFYPVIDQTALTLQSARGNWLWKLEAVSRSGPGDRNTQVTGGFEYTQVGVGDTRWNLGYVVEYLFDDRKSDPAAPYERDWFLGLRWALNDLARSEALFGFVWDPATRERLFTIEGARRLGPDYRLAIEGRFFAGGESTPQNGFLPTAGAKLGSVQQDDYLRLILKRFF